MFPSPLKIDFPAKVRGLTLIEVLITLLVLSIGLVGMAAMNLTSLQNAHSSYYTSIASTIALDFEERLWLRVANKAPGTCVDDGDVGNASSGVIKELMDRWSVANTGADPDPMIIPGLALAASTSFEPDPDPGAPAGQNIWTEVDLTVTWTDARFDDTEEFNYQARVLCRRPDPDA